MKRGQWIYIVALLALLYLPIFIVIAYAFNDARYSLLWHGFTLKWFHVLAEDQDLWIALGHSLLLGLFASIFATGIGTLTAVCLVPLSFSWSTCFAWHDFYFNFIS